MINRKSFNQNVIAVASLIAVAAEKPEVLEFVTVWGRMVRSIDGFYVGELGNLAIEYTAMNGRTEVSHSANIAVRDVVGGDNLVNDLVEFYGDQRVALDALAEVYRPQLAGLDLPGGYGTELAN